MTKPKRNIKYRSAKTGVIYDTKEEAIKDNARYLKDVEFRYNTKSKSINGAKDFKIPFIDSKRIILTNAGLATGAILSENVLDSIAKYADKVGLPVKTAIGLSVKESTLGNPTDDTSIYKILNSKNKEIFKNLGTAQNINKEGNDINARHLINFYIDANNPYLDAIIYALNKSGFSEPDFDNDKYIDYLVKGEKYADKKAKEFEDKYKDKNVLEAGFSFYKENPNLYNPGQSNYQQLVNKRAEEVWSSPEIQSWYRRRLENAGRSDAKEYGGIHIAPSKRGTFTAAATKHGMSVQEFASKVLRNKEDYSPSLVKKANFARNASKWNH